MRLALSNYRCHGFLVAAHRCNQRSRALWSRSTRSRLDAQSMRVRLASAPLPSPPLCSPPLPSATLPSTPLRSLPDLPSAAISCAPLRSAQLRSPPTASPRLAPLTSPCPHLASHRLPPVSISLTRSMRPTAPLLSAFAERERTSTQIVELLQLSTTDATQRKVSELARSAPNNSQPHRSHFSPTPPSATRTSRLLPGRGW